MICAEVIIVALSEVKPERSVVTAANVFGASAATASGVNLPTCVALNAAANAVPKPAACFGVNAAICSSVIPAMFNTLATADAFN